MKNLKIDWSIEKNEWLLDQRDLCFEDVLVAIESGFLLADEPSPNQADYPHQRILVVEIDEYACIVPYVASDDTLFLKTIYRSRVYQKKYLGDNHE